MSAASARPPWTSASWPTETVDAYGERGLNEHDFAAGALVAEEAGCWVRRPRLTSPLEGGPSADDERLVGLDMRRDTLEISGKFPL
jgi:myo-inositol-1(or 4)-monophosphatase